MTAGPAGGRREPLTGREGIPRPPGVPPPNLSAERIGFIGVEGLDALLPQGITYDTQLMAEGDTGVGKSVLAAQFLYEGMVTGDTCIYIACYEPPDVMRETMANFRLGTEAFEHVAHCRPPQPRDVRGVHVRAPGQGSDL